MRPVKRAQLDKNLPDWHNAAATLDALHYTYDRQNPRSSMSIRRRTRSEKLEIIYGASPADATLVVPSRSMTHGRPRCSTTWCSAACRKAEAGMAAAATGYYNAFVALVGGKSSAEMNTDPTPT